MANIKNIKGRLNIEIYRHFGDTDGDIGVNRMSCGYLSKDPVDIDPVELVNAWFKQQKNTTNDINNFDGTSMICFHRDAPTAKMKAKLHWLNESNISKIAKWALTSETGKGE